MQHTTRDPDVSPLPSQRPRRDSPRRWRRRPTIASPSCAYLIRALRTGGKPEDLVPEDTGLSAPPLPRSAAATADGGMARTVEARAPRLPSPSTVDIVLPSPSSQGYPGAPPDQTKTTRSCRLAPASPRGRDAAEPDVKTSLRFGGAAAPVEFKGGGILCPALVIGLGQTRRTGAATAPRSALRPLRLAGPAAQSALALPGHRRRQPSAPPSAPAIATPP